MADDVSMTADSFSFLNRTGGIQNFVDTREGWWDDLGVFGALDAPDFFPTGGAARVEAVWYIPREECSHARL